LKTENVKGKKGEKTFMGLKQKNLIFKTKHTNLNLETFFSIVKFGNVSYTAISQPVQ